MQNNVSFTCHMTTKRIKIVSYTNFSCANGIDFWFTVVILGDVLDLQLCARLCLFVKIVPFVNCINTIGDAFKFNNIYCKIEASCK